MIYIKNASEIAKIKAAVTLWKQVKQKLWDMIVVGNTPLMLSKQAEKMIHEAGGTCTFKNYHGFPGNICVSVNEVVIHGIPNNTPFKPTDKVSVDIGVSLNGGICDSGFTKLVDPSLNQSYQQLIDHNLAALWAGINAAVVNNYTGDIAVAIEKYWKQHCPQYSIIKDFTGHGCGLELHEDPVIFNSGQKPKTGTKLVPGMIITIEPMFSSSPGGTYWIGQDKWSVMTPKGGQVCHWEHMILITPDKCDVLTADDAEKEKFFKH